MSWNLNLDKAESINDNAIKNLPVGTNDFTIKSAEFARCAQDQTGQEHQIILRLDHAGEGYPVFLRVESGNEAQRSIANKTIKGFCDAAGITGTMTVDRLRTLANRRVRVTTRAKADTDNNGNAVTRVNIVTVDKVPQEDQKAPEEPKPTVGEKAAEPQKAAPVQSSDDKLPWETPY